MSTAQLIRQSRTTVPGARPSTDRSTAARKPARSATAPVDRDRFIDVLRVSAVLVVVALHWLMPVLSYDDGDVTTGNALAAPGAWIITWAAQVMPLVFFAGGAAAAMSYARHRRTSALAGRTWVARRLIRIAWPVIPLAAVWVPLPHILTVAGVPDEPLDLGARIVGQLLWFLTVYVVVIVLTPVLVRLHGRARGWDVAALAGVAVFVDLVRFGLLDGDATAGYLNVIIVWATVYQMGIAYAHGRWRRLTRPNALIIAIAGFTATALAVAVGPYTPSMIGMPGAPMSNMNPPTAVLISLAIGQLGLALAAKPAVERWARQAEPAKALDVINPRLMTIYLWHMPVLVMVAGVTVVGFGFSTPPAFGAEWREVMPIWLASAAAMLAGIVALMGRFEPPPRRLLPTGTDPTRLEAGAALTGVGLLFLTVFGFQPAFAPIPVAATTAIGVGIALLRGNQVTGSPESPQARKA